MKMMNLIAFAMFVMAGVKFGFANAILGAILLVAFAFHANKHEDDLIQMRKEGKKYPYGTYWPKKYDQKRR